MDQAGQRVQLEPMKPLVVSIRQLLELLPALSKSTIEREQRLGRFPRPRLLAARKVGWLLVEVEEWLASRPVSDLPPPPNTGAKKPKRPPAPPILYVPEEHKAYAAAGDVVAWMKAQASTGAGLYQAAAVPAIRARFGDCFVEVNQYGSEGIRRDVLKLFRQFTGIVWEREAKRWRIRRAGDRPGRVQD